MKARRTHPITVFAMLALLAMLLAPSTAAANPPAPGVVPPNENPLGVSYADWSARWWTWVLERPAPVNALFSEDCSRNQSGPVWFLVGTTGGSATRSCTVPADRFLYLPVVNLVYVATPDLQPGDSIELGRPILIDAMRTVHDVSVTVDNQAITGLSRYDVMSPGFTVALPGNNVFGLHPQDYEAIAKGIQVMLMPLSPGQHTIHTQAYMGDNLIDVTYHLTVVGH